MDHWIYENMIVFILASFSGIDLAKRFSVRAITALGKFPLRCYWKVAATFARGRCDELDCCRN